jgi:hypothetical protein
LFVLSFVRLFVPRDVSSSLNTNDTNRTNRY